MKSYKLYIAALAAIVLTMPACRQDEGIPEQTEYSDEAIVFTTPYSVRSSVLRNGDFNEGEQVGVIGYCNRGTHPEYPDRESGPFEWEAKKVFAMPDMFYNTSLTYEGNGYLAYSSYVTGTNDTEQGICPWYNDPTYLYSFFAYYPYVSVSGNNNEGTVKIDGNNSGTIRLTERDHQGNPSITYTMPYDVSSSSGTSLALNRVPDLMLAYAIDRRQANGAVQLDFRHMFTALQFEVNNYTSQDATIESIEIVGRNYYRSLTVTGEQSGYDVGTDRYDGTFTVVSGQGVTCPRGEGTIETGIMPTKTTIADADGDPITLMFITDDDNNNDNKGAIVDSNGSCEIRVTIAGRTGTAHMDLKENKTFNAGTRNIFSINLVGDDIVLQLRPTDTWEDDGDSDIVFE